MGKGPQKSSKKKRKPHDKFLKNLTYLLNEKRFENYKSLFKISKLNIKYKKGKNLKNYIVKDDLIIVRTM